MGLIKRLLPWYDEEAEVTKDKKAQEVNEKATRMEERLQRLAASHKAYGLGITATKQQR